MKAYLVTRPEHDDTTHYLSAWCKETVDLAEGKGIKVLDLRREKANKEEVESMLRKHEPALVVLNGHGDENTVTGHKNIPVVQKGENEGVLKSRIVYAISCSSAKKLGPASVDAGAISYIGYDDDFVFFYEPAKISKPLHDETAKLFLKPSQILIEALIKGNSVKESVERARALMQDELRRLLATPNTDKELVRYLWWNMRHFVAHGENLEVTVN
ncbi:MAG: hypothetical protein HYS81_04875 [Candidatus Aenigmatarchaeota archaeon]|nr:MAG: hypothetical protein HYS81_04875 [Candidatus Aenigmarchaeota archaeon]